MVAAPTPPMAPMMPPSSVPSPSESPALAMSAAAPAAAPPATPTLAPTAAAGPGEMLCEAICQSVFMRRRISRETPLPVRPLIPMSLSVSEHRLSAAMAESAVWASSKRLVARLDEADL